MVDQDLHTGCSNMDSNKYTSEDSKGKGNKISQKIYLKEVKRYR